MNLNDLTLKNGVGYPLGISFTSTGLNFAIFSEHASSATLCLFLPDLIEIPLQLPQNKTGNLWHIHIENLPKEFSYGYRFAGPFKPEEGLFYNSKKILTDPYSRLVNTPLEWGKRNKLEQVLSYFSKEALAPFDWENVQKPNLPHASLIIYEMHVRGFTRHPSSSVQHPATFLGIVEKIPYLKSLGINAIELMPIFEFDECSNHVETLYNYWGYSPLHFFQPMNRYSSSKKIGAVLKEFKEMVKELHKNQIEVILDVVYNHTAEEEGRILNLRGIDNPVYYLLDEKKNNFNFSGCGNTFHCNEVAARHLILDSLRYWTSEMQVDGFRFDLASILTRGRLGEVYSFSPILRLIHEDPILSQVKLIAEPWDAAGLYQVGQFPHFGKWSEWNDYYRDSVRRFIKGTSHQVSSFATVLCGSQNFYDKWGSVSASINFVTSHDGFTLQDLVSYQGKHNEKNGEFNRDGVNNNESWNCGQEGPTDNPSILALRKRQMKNFFVSLMISQGIPMILMGDEYGHTRFGNNNAWGLDDEHNWFLWSEKERNEEMFRFVSLMIRLRRNHPIFSRSKFLKKTNITWHGLTPFQPNWGSEEKFIAFSLIEEKAACLYIAFNAFPHDVELFLPPPTKESRWRRIVDTSKPSPEDFLEKPLKENVLATSYTLKSYSSFIAIESQ
jgi:isoamylase